MKGRWISMMIVCSLLTAGCDSMLETSSYPRVRPYNRVTSLNTGARPTTAPTVQSARGQDQSAHDQAAEALLLFALGEMLLNSAKADRDIPARAHARKLKLAATKALEESGIPHKKAAQVLVTVSPALQTGHRHQGADQEFGETKLADNPPTPSKAAAPPQARPRIKTSPTRRGGTVAENEAEGMRSREVLVAGDDSENGITKGEAARLYAELVERRRQMENAAEADGSDRGTKNLAEGQVRSFTEQSDRRWNALPLRERQERVQRAREKLASLTSDLNPREIENLNRALKRLDDSDDTVSRDRMLRGFGSKVW